MTMNNYNMIIYENFQNVIYNKQEFKEYSFDIISKVFLNFNSFFDTNYQNLEEAINDKNIFKLIIFLIILIMMIEEQDLFKKNITLESTEIAIEKLSSRHVYQYILAV